MAIRTINDSKLQDIAVAIQGKDGGGQMTVDEMPTRIAAIPAQDNTVLDSVIDGSITSIESDATSIRTEALSNCTSLVTANFPNAVSVGASSFKDCPSLSNVYFPNLTSTNSYSFVRCIGLESVELPKLTKLFTACFNGCLLLSSIYIPKVTTIGSSVFANCASLLRLFLPSVTSLNSSCFSNCSSLSLVLLGQRATLSNLNALQNCPAIIYVKPEDLSWYSTATNWSTLYAQDRIKSIEDLTGDDLVWYQEQLARYQAQTA